MELAVREEDGKASVQNYLGSSDFVLEHYKAEPASAGHTGYMGRHYILTAAFRSGDRLQEIRMFVKLPPIPKAHRLFVLDMEFLHRECTFYSHVAPLLRKSLPPTQTLPIPKCYFLRDTVHPDAFPAPGSGDEEIIILEDITRLGYRTLEKCPLYDLPHCRVVMKTLARFHAASILMAHPKSEDTIGKQLKEGASSFHDDLWLWKANDAMVNACIASLATAATKIWPEKFAGEKNLISETLKDAWESVLSIRRDFPEHARVMCHGDTWSNNLLFAYDGGDVPVDCILVDMQEVQYAPPVLDILIFLLTSTSREFRQLNADSLLEYYHYKLGEIVGTKLLETVLPLPAFLQSYADLKTVGLTLSSSWTPVFLEEEDDILAGDKPSGEPLDIEEAFLSDRGERTAENCRKSKAYADRVMECIRECFEGLGLWN